MTIRAHAPPTADLEPYRDACEQCMPFYEDRAKYTALPARIRHTRAGVVARYRHACGHTWTAGWFNSQS